MLTIAALTLRASEVTRLPIDYITGPTKQPMAARVRWAIMYVARRDIPKASNSFIAQQMGFKCHSSVAHGLNMAEGLLLDGDVWFATLVKQISRTRPSDQARRHADIQRSVRSGVPAATLAERYGLSVGRIERIAAAGG